MTKKPMLLLLTGCVLGTFLVTLLLPTLLVRLYHPHHKGAAAADNRLATMEQGAMVPVYLSKQKTVDRIPIEQYVQGVVAAEIPVATFEPEAIKAQALASRTYIVRRMVQGDKSNVPVKDAIVTDTIQHQAFWTTEEMKQEWGDHYETNLVKLTQAVKATEDEVITYQGEPIQAMFFSTSNGYTENAADYWGTDIPYLHSVPSPWDKSLSSHYQHTIEIPLAEFEAKLGLSRTLTASSLAAGSRVLATTDGHRVGRIRLGGATFTGREVREKLGLDSTQFSFRWKGDTVTIATVGYGHGVGLSQWGADGMAKEGKTAAQIIAYYYKGVSIEKDDRFLR